MTRLLNAAMLALTLGSAAAAQTGQPMKYPNSYAAWKSHLDCIGEDYFDCDHASKTSLYCYFVSKYCTHRPDCLPSMDVSDRERLQRSTWLILAQQLRQLGDVGRDPPRLVASGTRSPPSLGSVK